MRLPGLRSVHDRFGQMMRPPGGVIVGPQTGVDLGNDDLLLLRANIVDLFAEQSGGVDAVRPDLNFLLAIARNHLVGIDGMLKFRRVAHDSQEPQGDGNDVVGERRHLAGVFERELVVLS